MTFIKNILATVWLIYGATFWILLSSMSPQMGLDEIGENSNEVSI